MSYISDADLQRWFTYKTATGNQADRIEMIREAGLEFARVVNRLAPSSPDQTAAIRKIREAVMTANAAIVSEEKM